MMVRRLLQARRLGTAAEMLHNPWRSGRWLHANSFQRYRDGQKSPAISKLVEPSLVYFQRALLAYNKQRGSEA
jgi:hypothetical protein